MPVTINGVARRNTFDRAASNDNETFDRPARIRQLNDALRRSGQGGRVLLTASIEALQPDQQAAIVATVAGFEEFDEDSDPDDEHDSALLDVDGRLVLFRIDYYGLDLVSDSPDLSDATVTARVMTIWTPDDA